MKSIISLILISSIGMFGSYSYYGSTTAAVVLAGGIIKAKQGDFVHKKYKRQNCPVCKGKGWYISGDKISKVDCGYCEPESKQSLSIQCEGDKCETRVFRR